MAAQFTHLDFVSPYPVLMEGVGHIRSPKLHEIVLLGGESRYNSMLSVLLMTKVQLLEQLAESSDIPEDVLQEFDKLSLFELLVGIEVTRHVLMDAFSFFLTESVAFLEDEVAFVTYDDDQQRSPLQRVVYGRIDAENYHQVREVILRRNYMTPPSNAEGKRRSKRMIEYDKKIEAGRKKSARYKAEQKAMQLGNLVSKVSKYSTLNILNVFDLTVYQLYDQFFEINT